MKNGEGMYGPGGGGSSEGPRMPNIPEVLRGKSAKKEKIGVIGLDALENLKMGGRAPKKEPKIGLEAARVVTGGKTKRGEMSSQEVASAGLETFKKYQERTEEGGVQGVLDEAREVLNEQREMEKYEEAMKAPGEVIEVNPDNIDDILDAMAEKEKILGHKEFYNRVMDEIIKKVSPVIKESTFLKRVPSSTKYEEISEGDIREKLRIVCKNYLVKKFPQNQEKYSAVGADETLEILDMVKLWKKRVSLTEANADDLADQLADQFVKKFLEMAENSREYLKVEEIEREKEKA